MNTILIVDDSIFFLELIKSIFNRTGINTIMATNGADAIQALKKETPDLVLLDQYMPDMKGGELCEKLKTDPDFMTIPVIMVTASAKKEDVDRCFDAGCNDYVTKPINKEELLEKVKKYIPIIGRKYKRAPIYTDMKYIYEGKEYSGQLYVISEGGAFMLGEEMLPVDSKVRLLFSIPGMASSLDVTGDVVWDFEGKDKFPQLLAMAKGMGVRFTGISEKHKEAIASYVSLGNFSPDR